MNKQYFSKMGKEGAKKRWDKVKAKRVELLELVSAKVDKRTLNWIQTKWDNEQIELLLSSWQSSAKNKTI